MATYRPHESLHSLARLAFGILLFAWAVNRYGQGIVEMIRGG